MVSGASGWLPDLCRRFPEFVARCAAAEVLAREQGHARRPHAERSRRRAPNVRGRSRTLAGTQCRPWPGPEQSHRKWRRTQGSEDDGASATRTRDRRAASAYACRAAACLEQPKGAAPAAARRRQGWKSEGGETAGLDAKHDSPADLSRRRSHESTFLFILAANLLVSQLRSRPQVSPPNDSSA